MTQVARTPPTLTTRDCDYAEAHTPKRMQSGREPKRESRVLNQESINTLNDEACARTIIQRAEGPRGRHSTIQSASIHTLVAKSIPSFLARSLNAVELDMGVNRVAPQ